MRILVSGSSGFIGKSLLPLLNARGHSIIRLTRKQPLSNPQDISWDPASETAPHLGEERVDAVIHLAGENIAAGRWTAERKLRIRQSRVLGTRLLCRALARVPQPPRTFLCASALGYYGNRGSEWLTEEGPAGSGFLAEVCQAWEAESVEAKHWGARVVHLRFGIALGCEGGMLQRILPIFRNGLGGPIGAGEHYMSWIAIDDLTEAVLHCVSNAAVDGPVNIAGPNPITNREFARSLGKVLGRLAFLAMPAVAARLMFGEMAGELLLASQRAIPVRLNRSGFQFKFPALDSALRHLLGR